MSFLSKLNQRIEEQEWDHVTFLRNLLLLLGIVILFFYIWVLLLNLNGFIAQAFFINSLLEMVRGHVIGISLGILTLFLILIPYYRRHLWDLHIVVPQTLFIHLILSVSLLGLITFTSIFSAFFESAFLTGYLLGGLIPILAFAGEVKKEHAS